MHTHPQTAGGWRIATAAAAALSAIAEVTGGLALIAFGTLYTWQSRASERAQLKAMDDYMLKDIGITRADAARETTKPFWTA